MSIVTEIVACVSVAILGLKSEIKGQMLHGFEGQGEYSEISRESAVWSVISDISSNERELIGYCYIILIWRVTDIGCSHLKGICFKEIEF